MMPHDVSTCWNSIFDMLVFALEYHVPIDEMISNQDLNLRKYELQDDEWVCRKPTWYIEGMDTTVF